MKNTKHHLMTKEEHERIFVLRAKGVSTRVISMLIGCSGQTVLNVLKRSVFIPRKRVDNKRMYNIFGCLKQRCNNVKNKDYKYYGGRGIKCDWTDFPSFEKDMGLSYREGLTIDRIDNNGNYSKENCRWVTMEKQLANRRPFKLWSLKSKHYSINR